MCYMRIHHLLITQICIESIVEKYLNIIIKFKCEVAEHLIPFIYLYFYSSLFLLECIGMKWVTFSTTKNWFPVTIKLSTEKEILIRRYICVILIIFNCLFCRINFIRLNRIPISSNVALNLIFKYFITNQLINRYIERIIITFLRQGINQK